MRLIEYLIAIVMLVGLLVNPIASLAFIGVITLFSIINDSGNRFRGILTNIVKYIGKSIYWIIGGIMLIMMLVLAIYNPVFLAGFVFVIGFYFLVDKIRK